MNQASVISAMSLLCSVFLLVLLVDLLSLSILLILGWGLAFLCYYATSTHIYFGEEHIEISLVVLFVVIAGSTVNYKTAMLQQQRVAGMAAAAGMIAHELRTPLASVLGFIETLQGPARDDPKGRDRFLEIMRDQGRRMARLIDDLLSLSRIEQNEHLRPQASIDLVDVVRHVLDSLRPMAEAARSQYDLQLPERLIIPGDRDELVRLAENLVENAIKYGEREGAECKVSVSLTKTETQAILRVKDSGPGIAPEHLPRLTERFYRVDAGASRAKGGTGLGLALVKHIVSRHRGRLAIESKPGEGATFTVTLPLAAVRASS